MGPADLAAVLSPGGLPSATEDFTSDKARLLAAIDNFSGTKLTSATVERDQESRRFYDGVPMHGGKDPDDGERANRASSLNSTLQAIALHAERIEGRRKALLLFSEGIDYDTSDILGESQRYASEVARAMGRAAGALMRTNVALYSIDPRVLSTAQADIIETPIYERNPGKPGGFSERGIDEELRRLDPQPSRYGAGDRRVPRDRQGPRPSFRSDRRRDERVLRSWLHTSEAGQARRVAKPDRHHVAPRRDARRPQGIRDAAKGRDPRVAARKSRWPPIGGSPRQRRNMPASVLSPTAAPTSTPGVPGPLAQLLASPLPKSGLPLRVQAIPFLGG